MTQFNLIRNANVEVKQVSSGGSGTARTTHAEIVVNNKFQHRFPAKSRISQHLSMMEPKDLAERLSGGTFFFVNNGKDDQMVDFRDGGYNGFVHTDESVAKFMDIIGVQPLTRLPLHRARRGSASGDDAAPLVLRKSWSNNDIVVLGYKSGGEFSSRLSFVWNPFVKTINSSFDLVRLICSNAMVGLTPFLNTKIPLFNRWEEHLDIASRQIQHKVSTVVVDRVKAMSSERSSVGECLLLEQHAFDRLYSPAVKTQDERTRLLTLMTALSPTAHLGGVYKPEVFTNKALAAQLPAHLTHFDLWNIATEMRSHTNSTAKSSETALDRFANGLLFEETTDAIQAASTLSGPRVSAFSDPEVAFWGKVSA